MRSKNTFRPSGLAELRDGKRMEQSLLNGKGERRKYAHGSSHFLAYLHVAECRRWKADVAKKSARRSATFNISLFSAFTALGDTSDADYVEEEAESSGAGSSYASESEGEREAGAVQQEPARRVNHPHR